MLLARHRLDQRGDVEPPCRDRQVVHALLRAHSDPREATRDASAARRRRRDRRPSPGRHRARPRRRRASGGTSRASFRARSGCDRNAPIATAGSAPDGSARRSSGRRLRAVVTGYCSTARSPRSPGPRRRDFAENVSFSRTSNVARRRYQPRPASRSPGSAGRVRGERVLPRGAAAPSRTTPHHLQTADPQIGPYTGLGRASDHPAVSAVSFSGRALAASALSPSCSAVASACLSSRSALSWSRGRPRVSSMWA